VDDSIYRLRDRDLLTLSVLALLALGVVMVQSAAMNVGDAGLWQWSQRASRHALFAVLALLSFITASRLDYRRLAGQNWFSSPAVWGIGLAIALCAAVLLPGVGTMVNGARRWIEIGALRIQPSEVAKWGIVLFLAWRLSRPGMSSLLSGFLPTCAVVGVLCLLVVLEDFGTAALIGLVAFVMLLAGPVKWWHLAISVPPALAAAVAFVAIEPYRWRRMTAFLDPFANPETDGYHMIQSLYSFAGGGLTGRGLGNGVQKLGYLPEDTTDFIFAVICEELGLFGAGLVAVLYLTILLVGYSAARRAPSAFGRLLCFGTVATLGLQASLNIAVATASVPTKGMSLPLVSAGGSGLVLTAIMLGLVYSVCRGETSRLAGDEEGDFEKALFSRPVPQAADPADLESDFEPDADDSDEGDGDFDEDEDEFEDDEDAEDDSARRAA
jgi:cell division protein FtsW